MIIDVTLFDLVSVFSSSSMVSEMQTQVHERLIGWLADHDEHIDRFRVPIPVTAVAKETGLDADAIVELLCAPEQPCFHIWAHQHGKKVSRSKPYCLRLNGPDTVGLDWEYSIVGAVETEFRRQGFETCRELGSDEDIAHVVKTRSLLDLHPGNNQRDLWGLRQTGADIELWIIEAKGKEAAEFDHYCFAEALGQVFEVPGKLLTTLLGSAKKTSHGLCWKIADRIRRAWTQQGISATVVVGVLVPDWRPDVVWKAGAVQRIDTSFYARPLSSLFQFLETGKSHATSGKYCTVSRQMRHSACSCN